LDAAGSRIPGLDGRKHWRCKVDASREIRAVFEVKALGIGPGLEGRLDSSKGAIAQSHKTKNVLRVIVWSTELHSQTVSTAIEIVGIVDERLQSHIANVFAS
jgi:hypothetical protein